MEIAEQVLKFTKLQMIFIIQNHPRLVLLLAFSASSEVRRVCVFPNKCTLFSMCVSTKCIWCIYELSSPLVQMAGTVSSCAWRICVQAHLPRDAFYAFRFSFEPCTERYANNGNHIWVNNPSSGKTRCKLGFVTLGCKNKRSSHTVSANDAWSIAYLCTNKKKFQLTFIRHAPSIIITWLPLLVFLDKQDAVGVARGRCLTYYAFTNASSIWVWHKKKSRES